MLKNTKRNVKKCTQRIANPYFCRGEECKYWKSLPFSSSLNFLSKLLSSNLTSQSDTETMRSWSKSPCFFALSYHFLFVNTFVSMRKEYLEFANLKISPFSEEVREACAHMRVALFMP